jgi:hypothetical protein
VVNSPFLFSIPVRKIFHQPPRFFTSAADFTGELLQELLQEKVWGRYHLTGANQGQLETGVAGVGKITDLLSCLQKKRNGRGNKKVTDRGPFSTEEVESWKRRVRLAAATKIYLTIQNHFCKVIFKTALSP